MKKTGLRLLGVPLLAVALLGVPALFEPSERKTATDAKPAGEVLSSISNTLEGLGWNPATSIVLKLSSPNVRHTLYPNDTQRRFIETLDPHKRYEFRYWKRRAPFSRPGTGIDYFEGDLESIHDGPTKIADFTICPVHRQQMVRKPVRVIYGLVIRPEGDRERFPHAAVSYGGCVVMDDSPEGEPAYVCETCDGIYQVEYKRLLERLRR